jgi:hypothetical protein
VLGFGWTVLLLGGIRGGRPYNLVPPAPRAAISVRLDCFRKFNIDA